MRGKTQRLKLTTLGSVPTAAKRLKANSVRVGNVETNDRLSAVTQPEEVTSPAQLPLLPPGASVAEAYGPHQASDAGVDDET